MTNELIKSLIGKVCTIKVGAFEGYDKVTILEIVDNWVRIEYNGSIQLINTDYITSIRIMPDKYQRQT